MLELTIINLLSTILLPFFIIAAIGMITGLSPRQAFEPLGLLIKGFTCLMIDLLIGALRHIHIQANPYAKQALEHPFKRLDENKKNKDD